MVDVVLRGVEFGPTSGTTTGRALLSKRNGTSPVTTRWLPGMDRLDLVYPLVQKRGTHVSIDVSLRVSAPAGQTIWIRTRFDSLSSRALGKVLPTPLTLKAGQHDVSFTVELAGSDFVSSGVSRSLVVWTWEWAEQENGTYEPFETTTLRLYVTVREPVLPWTGGAVVGGEVIWTEVLDWSCRWAAAARTRPAASAAISRRIHELGHLGFTVSRASEGFRWAGGSAHLQGQAITCSDFLSLLSGETRRTKAHANCTDLAAIVLLFANALGCPLRVFRIAQPRGPLLMNPVRLIGHDCKGTIRVMPPGGFDYHDVAGRSRTGTPAVVYDACVALDSDGNPEQPPAFWASPAGVKRRGPGSYENRLLSPLGRADIRWKRLPDFFVDRAPPGIVPSDDDIAVARFHRYLRYLEAGRSARARSALRAMDEYELSPEPVNVREISTWFSGVVTEQMWLAESRQRAGDRVWISMFMDTDVETASRITAEVLARCQPECKLREEGGAPVLADDRGALGGFVVQASGVVIDGGNRDVSSFTAAFAVHLATR